MIAPKALHNGAYEHSALRRLSPMHTALSQEKNVRLECSRSMYKTLIQLNEFIRLYMVTLCLNSLMYTHVISKRIQTHV